MIIIIIHTENTEQFGIINIFHNNKLKNYHYHITDFLSYNTLWRNPILLH